MTTASDIRRAVSTLTAVVADEDNRDGIVEYRNEIRTVLGLINEIAAAATRLQQLSDAGSTRKGS